MINTLHHDQFTRLAVTLWSISTTRRKAIHEEMYQSPLSTFGFINSYISELNAIAKSPRTTAGQQSKRRENASWIPSTAGSAKINCDAAVSRSGDRGVATAICIDGLYLGASAIVIVGIYDPPSLEALACREALALAEDLALQHTSKSARAIATGRKIYLPVKHSFNACSTLCCVEATRYKCFIDCSIAIHHHHHLTPLR
jgi:hypothetical protein